MGVKMDFNIFIKTTDEVESVDLKKKKKKRYVSNIKCQAELLAVFFLVR